MRNSNLEAADKQFDGNSLAAKALLEATYFSLGDIKMEQEMRKAYRSMTPRTPEDYLYGGLGLTDIYYDKAITFLEELATKYPLPRVHYFLGRAYYWKLVNTYSASGIDRTIQVVTAAQTTLPGDLFALRRQAGAHLTAADIYEIQGNQERCQHHLYEAKKTADYMLTHHPDDARTYQVSTQLAALEGDWERAVTNAREANRRAKELDDLAALAPLLYRAGRVPETITEFDQLSEGIKNYFGIERVLYVAEWKDVDEAIAYYAEWFDELKGDQFWARAEYVYSTFAIFGLLDQAKQRSVEYLDRIGPPLAPDDFTSVMDKFIRGETKIDQLIESAETRFERMRAHFLKGCIHLGRGEAAEAKNEFKIAESEGMPSWGIHTEDTGRRAAVLLHRMRQDPNWPPWTD